MGAEGTDTGTGTSSAPGSGVNLGRRAAGPGGCSLLGSGGIVMAGRYGSVLGWYGDSRGNAGGQEGCRHKVLFLALEE